MKRFLKLSLLLAATVLAALPIEVARRHRKSQDPVQQPAPQIQVQTASAPEAPKPAIQVSTAPAPAKPVIQVGARPVAAPAAPKVVRDGEYTDKDHICWYIVAFGALPRNFITKNEARRLGWQGGPVEPYAPGKSIGGDRYGNYEGTLPAGRYRECDVDTKGRPRGAKRIVFSDDRRVYYSDDHYRTFKQIH